MGTEKKLEKLLKRQEFLQARIGADSEELKTIQTEIKLLSYEQLEDELQSLGSSMSEITKLADKMTSLGISLNDVDELLGSLSETKTTNSEMEEKK